MDKNAIYKYAVWARNELIARVTQKAEQYEITAKKTTPKDADSIGYFFHHLFKSIHLNLFNQSFPLILLSLRSRLIRKLWIR